MTDPTSEICKAMSRKWAFHNRLGRKLANATCWYAFRWWAYAAGTTDKPKSDATRGPASKELCMRRVYEADQLEDLTRKLEHARSIDFANHAATKAAELVGAAVNNDAHGFNQILNSYKKAVPMFQERLINDAGFFTKLH